MPTATNVTPMLKSLDLQETVAFYRDVLGFTVDTIYPEDAPVICFLDMDDVHLAFYLDTEGSDGAPAMTGQLYIDPDGVAELHERVEEEAEVLWGPEVYSYGKREFALRDPNGYTLTFGEFTDDPVTCPDP